MNTANPGSGPGGGLGCQRYAKHSTSGAPSGEALARLESAYRKARTLALVAHPNAATARTWLHHMTTDTFGTDRAGVMAMAYFYSRCARVYPDSLLLRVYRVRRQWTVCS